MSKNFNDYVTQFTPIQQDTLLTLRDQILSVVSDAEECISYGLPVFRKGRIICGIGAGKNHCALYMFNGTTIDAHSDELTGYDTTKSAIRFPPEKPLPSSLVTRLVKIRLEENDALDRGGRKS